MIDIARRADAAAPDVEDAAGLEMAVRGFEGGVGEGAVVVVHVVVVGGGDGGVDVDVGVCCTETMTGRLVSYLVLCCVLEGRGGEGRGGEGREGGGGELRQRKCVL